MSLSLFPLVEEYVSLSLLLFNAVSQIYPSIKLLHFTDLHSDESLFILLLFTPCVFFFFFSLSVRILPWFCEAFHSQIGPLSGKKKKKKPGEMDSLCEFALRVLLCALSVACASGLCASALFFCARQCSKPCDASSVSEEAGNLGFGFSPELLSFTFSSGMLPSGAHTLSLPQTHTESLIITGQLRSVQTGSAADFLCHIKTPVPFLLILNIGLQTLKENIYTHRLTKNALIKCRCSGAECMMQQHSHPCLCSLGERKGRGAPEKKETYRATRKTREAECGGRVTD